MLPDYLQPLNFDTTELLRVPVTIGGVQYELVEATGEDQIRYTDAMTATAKMENGIVVGIQHTGHMDLMVVGMCLRHEDGKTVSKAVLSKWPAKIITKIAKQARLLSAFEEPETLDTLREQRTDLDRKIKAMEASLKNEEESTAVGNEDSDSWDG